jgi:hypothetical protein
MDCNEEPSITAGTGQMFSATLGEGEEEACQPAVTSLQRRPSVGFVAAPAEVADPKSSTKITSKAQETRDCRSTSVRARSLTGRGIDELLRNEESLRSEIRILKQQLQESSIKLQQQDISAIGKLGFEKSRKSVPRNYLMPRWDVDDAEVGWWKNCPGYNPQDFTTDAVEKASKQSKQSKVEAVEASTQCNETADAVADAAKKVGWARSLGLVSASKAPPPKTKMQELATLVVTKDKQDKREEQEYLEHWADPIDPREIATSVWEQRQKRSSLTLLDFDADGRPRNPIGRTGLRGRGSLGNCTLRDVARGTNSRCVVCQSGHPRSVLCSQGVPILPLICS